MQEFYSLIKDSEELKDLLGKQGLFKEENMQNYFNVKAYQLRKAFDEEEAEIRRINKLVTININKLNKKRNNLLKSEEAMQDDEKRLAFMTQNLRFQ